MISRDEKSGQEHAAGFTLVELLVVLTIGGLALAAAPSLFAGMSGLRSRGAAEAFVFVLSDVRTAAIRSSRRLALTIEPETKRYFLPGSKIPHSFASIVDQVRVSRGDAADLSPTLDVQFFPDGSSSGGNVIFSSGSAQYQVAINPLTGRSRVSNEK